ncbi:hypothetical protein FACS189440_20930 [Bacteroidia bacterium]|nr:hypothetical protein FACS189440_20930 [Bacteroidia bacterium]
MKMKKMMFLMPTLILLGVVGARAQVLISPAGIPVEAGCAPSAVLELRSSNSGLLLPQVQLNTTDDTSTLTDPEPGMLVNNLEGDLPHGVYYWDGVKWTLYSESTVLVTGVDITPDNKTIYGLNHTTQLTAIITPENATEELLWTSSDPGIATVNNYGLVTALQDGTVTITVATASLSAQAEIRVRDCVRSANNSICYWRSSSRVAFGDALTADCDGGAPTLNYSDIQSAPNSLWSQALNYAPVWCINYVDYNCPASPDISTTNYTVCTGAIN